MRERWSIVLVDEFQDTDPVQWQVLDRAFSRRTPTMVLIGDPKQAIYAFRGGDVTTYLAGRGHRDHPADPRGQLAQRRRPCSTPSRSCWSGPRSATTAIVVRAVSAHHQESRLRGAPVAAPFRLRVVRRETFGKRPARHARPSADVRPHVARDLALDIRRLLASGATFDGRPLEPRDVAVICYRHADLAGGRSARCTRSGCRP